VPGAAIAGAGTVRHVQSLRTPVAILFSMGIEFEPQRPAPRWSMPRFGRKPASRPKSNGTLAEPIVVEDRQSARREGASAP